MKQTKIIATISGLRCEPEFLKALINEGVNVVRLNTAHMSVNELDHVVDRVRAISKTVGILMDTKGPEVRTTRVEAPIEFTSGDQFYISYGDEKSISSRDCIYVSYPDLAKDLEPGSEILIDDGEIEIAVIAREGDRLLCESLNRGVLNSRKSVNVPGVRINLPSVSERDKQNIKYAIKKGIDFIAHSFVRSKQDVLEIQKLLDEGNSSIKIIAKIENQEGVDNIDEILSSVYGIMVARGDLGVEIAQEKIPAVQRNLIRKSVEHKKPVIVATQMLHSMIEHPRPTRAEVSDIANAIYYRTDAVMLSGETANGLYPVESVKTMSRIIAEAERSKLEANDIRVPFEKDDVDTTSFLAKQAVRSVNKLGVRAIITDSFTGRTARILAAFRGRVPVFAICYNEAVPRQLALSYGVWAEYQPLEKGRISNLHEALERLVDFHFIDPNELVAYISGSPGGDSRSAANTLEIGTVESLMNREKDI